MTNPGELKQRLAVLRGQRGVTPSADAATPALGSPSSLAERLHRLGGNRPAMAVKRPGPTDSQIAELLEGQCLAPGLILVERHFPVGYRHGRCVLQWAEHVDGFGIPSESRPEQVVFMDTETTGLAGGTGTLVFLLGLARYDGGVFRVRQYFLTRFAGEEVLLRSAAAWLEGARSLVTFNGKSFDAPLLATRYRLAGLTDPFSPLCHVDLVHGTRRAFQKRWPDCRLQTAEQALLGFRRSRDLPGEQVPAAWFALVRAGHAGQVPDILEHNRWDLVSLASLLTALGVVYEHPAETGANLGAIARWHVKRGNRPVAYRQLVQNRESLDEDELLLLAHLHRRNSEWQAAVAIWERLAEKDCAAAVESLAKYHEHEQRDYRTALVYTERLLSSHQDNPAHQHRYQRLREKLSQWESWRVCQTSCL